MYQLGLVVRPDGADTDVADFARPVDMPGQPLTRLEARLLRAMQESWQATGSLPRREELAARVQLSRSTMHYHMRALVRKGYVVRRSDAVVTELTALGRGACDFNVVED